MHSWKVWVLRVQRRHCDAWPVLQSYHPPGHFDGRQSKRTATWHLDGRHWIHRIVSHSDCLHPDDPDDPDDPLAFQNVSRYDCLTTCANLEIVCFMSLSQEKSGRVPKRKESWETAIGGSLAEGSKNEKGHQAFEKDVSRVPGRLSRISCWSCSQRIRTEITESDSRLLFYLQILQVNSEWFLTIPCDSMWFHVRLRKLRLEPSEAQQPGMSRKVWGNIEHRNVT